MLRLVLAILLAPVFFGILLIPGNLFLFSMFPEAADGSVTPIGFLLSALGFSLVYSLVAGYCSAWVAGNSERHTGLGAGIALLVVGLGVQISSWELAPVWYHLAFLALLIPAAMYGTRLAGRGDSVAATDTVSE